MTLFPLKMRYGFESPSILCTGYMCVFDSFIVGERDKIDASVELGSFDEYMFYVGNGENQYGKKARIRLPTYIVVLMTRQVLHYPSVTIPTIVLMDPSLNFARILQFLLPITEQSTHHVEKSVLKALCKKRVKMLLKMVQPLTTPTIPTTNRLL